MHALFYYVFLCLFCLVIDCDSFVALDCPECNECDCNDCLNNNEGKCHSLSHYFPMHVVVIFSSYACVGLFSKYILLCYASYVSFHILIILCCHRIVECLATLFRCVVWEFMIWCVMLEKYCFDVIKQLVIMNHLGVEWAMLYFGMGGKV